MKQSLFDLIQERFHAMNELLENLWVSFSNKSISLSEWNVIAKIFGQKMFMSQVTKQVSISRQATHKIVKRLEEKGIVEIFKVEYNKRDNCICLTPYGEQCYKKYEELKKEIEKEIIEKIGDNNFQMLKTLLQRDWGL